MAGATAMTVVTRVERRLRGRMDHPVDYDASHYVVDAVAQVVGRAPQGPAERTAYFALAHWGYGSVVALAYPVLLSTVGSRRRAAGSFYAGCQLMAVALLPALGGAPSPGRWPRDVAANSLVQHAIYVAVVVVVTGGRPRGSTVAAYGAPTSTPGDSRPDHAP